MGQAEADSPTPEAITFTSRPPWSSRHVPSALQLGRLRSRATKRSQPPPTSAPHAQIDEEAGDAPGHQQPLQPRHVHASDRERAGRRRLAGSSPRCPAVPHAAYNWAVVAASASIRGDNSFKKAVEISRLWGPTKPRRPRQPRRLPQAIAPSEDAEFNRRRQAH